LDKVCWTYLSYNPNPKVIRIFEQHTDKCKFGDLHFGGLYGNPNIFEYDYEAMKTNMYKPDGIGKALMENMFHPRNMHKWKSWGFAVEGIDDDCDDIG